MPPASSETKIVSLRRIAAKNQETTPLFARCPPLGSIVYYRSVSRDDDVTAVSAVGGALSSVRPFDVPLMKYALMTSNCQNQSERESGD